LSSRRERRSARFERWRERRIYRLSDRFERRRERFALRWQRLGRSSHRRGLLTDLRHRWLAGAERLEVLEELLLIRWNRSLLHLSAGWERLPGPASRGGALTAAGVCLTIAVALVVMLPLRNATRTDSGPTPIVLPDTGAEIAPTREASAPSTSAANPSTAVGAWEEHANPDLGHRFSYPSDWDVDESSGATVLSDAADQVVIEFLRAPPGRLTTASDQLVEQVTAPFSGFATLATETARTEQGYPSTSVGGSARDAEGTSIQLVVTTIRGPDGNHAIVVRFPASDPGDLDAVVQVIASFRLV
jgi:hypothetical protein